MALQPQLMTDTDHAQALTRPTVAQPQNTTSTVQDKVQSKRQHLVTPHTINMALKLVATKQILTAQPHLMTNTVERLAHSKPIPLVKQPNTTATVEKSEVLNRHYSSTQIKFSLCNASITPLVKSLHSRFIV